MSVDYLPKNETLPWWVSSRGFGIADRIKSATAIIVLVAGWAKISIGQDDVMTGADLVEALVVAALGAAGAVWHALAWVRYIRAKQQKLGKFADK